MPSMRHLRNFTFVVPLFAAVACDPIPYADIRVTPAAASRPIDFDAVATLSARVLGRHGFIALGEPCFDTGRGFQLEVLDATRQPPEPTMLKACVLPADRGATVWVSEDRLAGQLLPISAAVVQELADSLRGIGRVRVKT